MRSEPVKLGSNSTMKSKLSTRIPAPVILCLVTVFALTTMTARAADKKAPVPQPTPVPGERYGLSPGPPPPYGLPAPPPGQARDLPGQAPKEWKDPNWKDPDIVLTNVNYEGIPLGEVAVDLRTRFKDYFDVLLPHDLQYQTWNPGPVIDPNTGLPLPAHAPVEVMDATTIQVKLQLKNVTASEVFNAMNLVFETENAPWRWELAMNGKRPTAVLRVLRELVPGVQALAPPFEPKKERMILFVGDLIGDEKSGGMTMDKIRTTILEVCSKALGRPPDNLSDLVKFHEAAQLLIVTGTSEETRVVQNTLAALKQKVRLETERKTAPPPPGTGESKPKSEATNTR